MERLYCLFTYTFPNGIKAKFKLDGAYYRGGHDEAPFSESDPRTLEELESNPDLTEEMLKSEWSKIVAYGEENGEWQEDL